jgi:signal transduction histidine kinase
MVDNFRICEVLANLLDNAISYTKSGARITVTIKQKDEEIVTTVADTGPGISEANLKHLFTKFYRVTGTLSEGSKGTGLGLFIYKSIVEMHRGRIWVESQLGKGTKFFFSLPAVTS